MNKIIFPLNQDMRGTAVADLQDALLELVNREVLLAAVPPPIRQRHLAELRRERADQRYGNTTSRLVQEFQQERWRQATGAVDERTANALNWLLEELGLLIKRPGSDPGLLDTRYTVLCKAVDAQSRPIAGLRIEAFDEDEESMDDPLGEPATTDEGGLATFRFKRSDYIEHPEEPGPDLYFKVYRGEHLLEYLLPGMRAGQAVIRNFKPQREPVVLRVDKHQVVSGLVVQQNGLPAERLKLVVHHLAFGGKRHLLGETSVDAQGRYALPYDPGACIVNLQISASDTRDPRQTIPLMKPRFGAAPQEVINLVAPSASVQAEYRRLSAGLTPHVGDMARLREARENDEQQDLTVLSRSTGWDARLIALAAISQRLGSDEDVKLPVEAVYGLLRAGLPSDKRLLAMVDPDVIEQAIEKVREAGIIESSDEEIEKFKKQFTTFSHRVRLNIPAPGSSSTYGELLEGTGLPRDAQDRFVPIYLNHRGDAARLWEKTREAGLDEDQINRLRLHGKLAFLAGYSAEMTGRLLQKGIDEPAGLVEQDYQRAETWRTEVLEQAGVPASRWDNLSDAEKEKLDGLIPPAYAGDTMEDRLQAYTEDMARKVRLSYPTQVVSRMIESGAISLPMAQGATTRLLENATKQGFRLGETPVTRFFKERSEVAADLPPSEAQAAIQQLQKLQRVYQITPSNEAMAVLMHLDITSAYDVMAYAEEDFDAIFETGYLEIFRTPPLAGLARLIRRKSEQVSSVTYNLFSISGKLQSEPPIAGLSAPVELREHVRNELIKHFPTMESLFGSLDFCECEHCRSVLSPAAYLVDLLQFLDPEPGVWGNFLAHWKATHGGRDYPHRDANGNPLKPYDVLTERRSDLPHILLTCENTHTALPYIDIVNEILEYSVAHGKLTEDAAQDTGEATTAELLAEPQNVIRQAYERLNEARYPLNLPFDLWLETARQFCDYFEMPLHRVLERFRASDALFEPEQPFDRAGVFMESLGLSPAEVEIFADPNLLENWWELYGYTKEDESTAKADLESAKALSRRLGVTYKEITEIVQTAFVNPELVKLSLLYKLRVSIGDAKLYKDEKPFFETNKELIGKKRNELSAMDQARFDSLDEVRPDGELTGWQVLNEVAAFKQRLDDLAAEFNGVDLQSAIEAMPFDRVLVLADPHTGCSFEHTILQYADGTGAEAIDFLRINLFVRLWRKLGWTIEETDRALSTFVPKDAPFDEDTANLEQKPLETALIYLSHLKTLDETLKIGRQSRLKLLTLWSDIATTGRNPLYAQLFLTRSVLKSDPVFDHPLGEYLTVPDIKVTDHILSLQGALGLTANEITIILDDAGQPLETAGLSLRNVSLLYRYGLLAKALTLSVRELIALKQLSGLDPFRELHPGPLETLDQDYPFVQTLEFVKVADQVRGSGLQIDDLDYLLRHRFDETGKYRPDREAALALLKTLAEGVRAIRAEHAVPDHSADFTDELQRLIHQFLVEILTAQTGADPALVESLITDVKMLKGGDGKSLVDTFGTTADQDAAAWDAAERALVLLNKALQLVQTLDLSVREMRYLLAHKDDFGGVDLSGLPTRAIEDTPEDEAAAIGRFQQFLRLAAYASLKREMAGGTDDVIAIFEANGTDSPGKLEEQVYPLIAKLTRRDQATVKACAGALAADPGFENERPLWRLWEALRAVERFGVPTASLVEWTRIVNTSSTPEARFGIAREVRESVKARFEADAWQRVAQPIFDKLRQLQRDALVSHVQHEHGFDRMEQLYEHFLIDPGMEPVVQTSRIRQAISSVQLFIQRSLLNLETKVHPSTINSKHWEWMKRYRVWEANRKIFLFPENWLEPEFRDDKTHLFSELEGALLQGDVSSDLVEDAFLNYLKKLDELARLDIVAMHIEDNPDPARRTLHVFGRTYSQPHKYFYRRYAHQMWTPWEPVNAEISGDHLAPVVWRDRLYLFWVTFMDKPVENPALNGDAAEKDLTALKLSEAVSSLQTMVDEKQVDIQLHWSEYLQGAWSTSESSGFSEVMSKTVAQDFNPREVFIHVSKEYTNGAEGGVYVHLGGKIEAAFFLAGRNSAAESRTYAANGIQGAKPENPYTANKLQATRYSGTGGLGVRFQKTITTEQGDTQGTESFSILREKVMDTSLTHLPLGPRYTLLPSNNNLTAMGVSEEAFQDAVKPEAVKAVIESGLGEIMALMKPVFYQDNSHTFFVEPNVTEETLEAWDGWMPRPIQPEFQWSRPGWWDELEVIPAIPTKEVLPGPRGRWQDLELDRRSLINPGPVDDWLLNPGTVLLFDSVLIGATGQPGLHIRTGELSADIAEAGGSLNVNPGSSLAAGETIVVADSGALQQSGLVPAPGGLNVVGQSGFNAALSSNFKASKLQGFGAGTAVAGISRCRDKEVLS